MKSQQQEKVFAFFVNKFRSKMKIITQIQLYTLLLQQRSLMNKIDLIFEKEPPEVQRKLMNLLIQYNAIMQYNKESDNFQVDLLLPFKTNQEKEEFIENFKSRSNKKQKQRQHIHEESMRGGLNYRNRIKSESSQDHHMLSLLKQDNHRKLDESSQIQKENQHSSRGQQAEISLDFTNEIENSRSHTISLRDISSVIQSRIKQAVQEIKNETGRKSRNGSMHQEHLDEPSNYSNPYEESSLHLNKVEIDEHHSISQHTQREVNFGSNSNSRKVTSKSNSKSDRKRENSKNFENSHRSSEIQEEMRIEQYSDEQNPHSMKRETYEKHGNPQIKPFHVGQAHHQDYMDETWDIHHDQSLFRSNQIKEENDYKTIQFYQRQAQAQQSKQDKLMAEKLKSNLSQRYKTKKSNQAGVRERYTEFLKKNHKDFEKIYQNIRKDIKRNNRQLRKSRNQDPILILEENLNTASSDEDRIFKEEMIKDYEKHILVQNQCMSSEDLVKYFKYLLEHAKNLYVKHLRKGK